MYLVAFDCDGTLVDSQHSYITAINEAFAFMSLRPPSRARILRHIGLPTQAVMRAHAPDIDENTLARMSKVYNETLTGLSQQDDRGEVLFDGMRHIIETLGKRDDVLLAIITMKSRRGLMRVVDVHNIRSFFQSLQSADDGPGKPAPDLLLAAMRECGIAPERTIMVGDTIYDILMAQAAKAKAIGIGWGYQTRAELEEAGADVIVEESSALYSVLADMMRA